MKALSTYLDSLSPYFKEHGIRLTHSGDLVLLVKGKKQLRVRVLKTIPEQEPEKADLVLPFDYLVREPEKIAAALLSKLGSNKTVFARQCDVKPLTKKDAENFLNHYHVMKATQSAYNLGLFFNQELLALASFSKGRKMNRLPAHRRSFELIRFCCKSGYTITGGLSKLVRTFAREKKAGDIMTYVNRQWSDGRSFISAGFTLLEKGNPNYFLVNRHSFERTLQKVKPLNFDSVKYYLTRDSGNLKMVYTVHENA